MDRSLKEKSLHGAFEIGVVVKGIDGIAELVGGFLLLFVSPGTIQNIFLFFARREFAEDSKDLVANYLLYFLQGLSTRTIFYGWLFIVHGAVKVFLVAGLLKHKLWAYPSAIAAFSLFVLYQIYQMTFDYSPLLLLITVVDIIVVGLTIHEYKEVMRTRRQDANPSVSAAR